MRLNGSHGFLFIPIWVAGIAGRTGIAVIGNIIMLVSQVVGIVVLVAVNAAKGGEIARRGVAFGAIVPFPLMFSTKNRKIQLVVL